MVDNQKQRHKKVYGKTQGLTNFSSRTFLILYIAVACKITPI